MVEADHPRSVWAQPSCELCVCGTLQVHAVYKLIVFQIPSVNITQCKLASMCAMMVAMMKELTHELLASILLTQHDPVPWFRSEW